MNSKAEFAEGLWAVAVAWGQHVRGGRACLSPVSILRDSWGANLGPGDGKKKPVYLGRPCQNKAISPHSLAPGFSTELPKPIFCNAPQLSNAPSPPGLRLQQLLINVWNQQERTSNFQGLNTEFLKAWTLLWPSHEKSEGYPFSGNILVKCSLQNWGVIQNCDWTGQNQSNLNFSDFTQVI